MTKIESLADLRPGDIFFGPISGAVGIGVGIGQALLGEGWSVGPLKIRHVGIVVEAGERLPVSQLPNGPLEDYDGTSALRAPRMVQAMPHGAEEIPLTAEKHWTSKCAYVRLPEDWPGQLADAAAVARLMVSEQVAYSFASYAALALWHWGWETKRLESWIDRRGAVVQMDSWSNGPEMGSKIRRGGRLPREAICSVLVDQAWTLAGKSVMIGTPKQVVTPGALAGRLLFETPGAQWALPGRTATVL